MTELIVFLRCTLELIILIILNFIKEFVDARRLPNIQNAPQVLYSHKEPPLEIRHLSGFTNLKENENVGFVTFGMLVLRTYIYIPT